MKRIIDFELQIGDDIETVRIEFEQKTNDPMIEAFALIRAHEKCDHNIIYWWWIK